MPAETLEDIRCVLFDMDGVLVDVSQSYRTAIARTAEAFTSQDVTAETIQSYKNRGGFNDDWELTHAIIRERGVDADFDDVVSEFQQLYRGSDWNGLIRREPPLMARAVLEDLAAAGAALGVVTGRPEAEALWTIELRDWTTFFSVVIAREQQADRPKPDGFPLSLALKRLGDLPAASAVYVGDTVDDMMAASHAGVAGIGFVPPYLDAEHARRLSRSGARLVISRHEDLPRILSLD